MAKRLGGGAFLAVPALLVWGVPGAMAIVDDETEASTVTLTVEIEDAIEGESTGGAFKIAPTPPGETAIKAWTNEEPTMTWQGLIDGQEYQITTTEDLPELRFSAFELACEPAGTPVEEGVSFTATSGADISCTAAARRLPWRLHVHQTVVPHHVQPGETVTITVAMSNAGPGLAPDVLMYTQLPEELEIIQVGWVDMPCGHVGNVVTCSTSYLYPIHGYFASIRARVATTASGLIVNTATFDSELVPSSDGPLVSTTSFMVVDPQAPTPTLPPTGGQTDRWASVALLTIVAGIGLVSLSRWGGHRRRAARVGR